MNRLQKTIISTLLLPCCLIVACRPIGELSDDGSVPARDGQSQSEDKGIFQVVKDADADTEQEVSPRKILFGHAFSGHAIDKVRDHTSIVHVLADIEGDTDLQQLQQAREAGLKVVISTTLLHIKTSCEDWFSEKEASVLAWNAYAKRIKPFTDVIVAFHPIDEPYWNCGNISGMEPQRTAQMLDEINVMIKQDFPDKKILAVFGGFSVNPELILPASFDWVSFDCYYYFDSCGDDAHGRHSVPEYISILESKMTPEQRLVLIPPAWKLPRPLLEEINLRYYDLALGNHKVEAVVTFLWGEGLLREEETLGVMPKLWPFFRDLGGVLTDKVTCEDDLASASRPAISLSKTLCGPPAASFVAGRDNMFWRIIADRDTVSVCIEHESNPRCDDPSSDSYTPLARHGFFASGDELRMLLTKLSLQTIAAGRYRIYLYDSASLQTTQAEVELLPCPWNTPMDVRVSKRLDGPKETFGFHRGVDQVFWRVDNVASGQTYVCWRHVATEPATKCENPLADSYAPLRSPEWSYSDQERTYRGGPSDLTEIPEGTYHLYFHDRSNDQLQSAVITLH